jgi:putative addiction module component (TIGR02574 family)
MKAKLVLQLLGAKGGSVMSKRGAEVLEEALSLPPGERAEVADRLLASLDSLPGGRIDALWAAEAEDRLEAFEQGEIKAVSADDAFGATGGVKP